MKIRRTMGRIKGVTSRETRGIEEGRVGSGMEIHDRGPESRIDHHGDPENLTFNTFTTCLVLINDIPNATRQCTIY
jgi:hypothetical protein